MLNALLSALSNIIKSLFYLLIGAPLAYWLGQRGITDLRVDESLWWDDPGVDVDA